MNPRALSLAHSRLRIAERAVADIADSRTAEEVADHWLVFLTAWKGVYTVLEQGSKDTTEAKQWFGRKKGDRRSTPLLQFLYQARNAAEHGLGQTVINANLHQLYDIREHKGKQLSILWDPLRNRQICVDEDGNEPLLLEEELTLGSLVPVYDARGKTSHFGSLFHRGEPINPASPIAVARAGLAEIQQIVLEARSLAQSTTAT